MGNLGKCNYEGLRYYKEIAWLAFCSMRNLGKMVRRRLGFMGVDGFLVVYQHEGYGRALRLKKESCHCEIHT